MKNLQELLNGRTQLLLVKTDDNQLELTSKNTEP